MVLMVSIVLSYTYTMAKHQYLRKRVMHAFALYGHTLSDGWLDDFENLTQSEAREPPTSGCKSVMEGPRILLIVSIVFLYYTYTMIKQQYLSSRRMLYLSV